MNALALVEAADHVCCRYRIRAFEAAWASAGGSLRIEGIETSGPARWRQFARASHNDVVLLQRRLLPAWEFARLRRFARRLVFDFDDAVFRRDSFQRRGFESRKRRSRFERTVRRVDAVIAGNEFLVGRAILAGAEPSSVHLLPTCVNPELYSPREHAREARPRLVWIGSSSTLRGIESQRALWGSLAERRPELLFRIVCDRKPDLGRIPVEFVPWSEATEAEALADADIGVAWMPDDIWSLGKCGLKVLQYQAAGLPVVANPVGVHLEMIEPGRSGFLPNTEEGWLEAIDQLVGDEALRRRMGARGRATLEARYATERWAPVFIQAVSANETARGTTGRRPRVARKHPSDGPSSETRSLRF